MTRYLLDTTVLIDFSKDREPVRSRLLDMVEANDELGVCAVNVAEFYSGALFGQHVIWDEFIAALEYWQIVFEDGVQAGQYRWHFARAGRAISTNDAMIAAVARRVEAVIVTANVNDYPMADVELLALG